MIIGVTKGFIRGKALSVEGHTHNYAPTTHIHDDRYYTESETNTLLAGKAASVHAHTMNQITNLDDEINSLKSSVSNGKSLIASAITDKGVSTASNATFQTMADNIGKIEIGHKYITGTVIPEFTYLDSQGSARRYYGTKILISTQLQRINYYMLISRGYAESHSNTIPPPSLSICSLIINGTYKRLFGMAAQPMKFEDFPDQFYQVPNSNIGAQISGGDLIIKVEYQIGSQTGPFMSLGYSQSWYPGTTYQDPMSIWDYVIIGE